MKSHENRDILLHIKQYIESIESQLQTIKHLVKIGLAGDNDDKILPDVQDSVQEEKQLKLPAKPTLTKELKRLNKLTEGRAWAQLWVKDLQAKKKQQDKTKK